MTRGELKLIVKECLIEILSEGINAGDSIPTSSSSIIPERAPVRQQASKPMRRSPLDEKANVRQNTQLRSNINAAVKIASDDPMMQGIFADTIATVQKQNAGGHNQGAGLMGGRMTAESVATMNSIQPPADRAAAVVANTAIDELFEGSDRWAKLAFMG